MQFSLDDLVQYKLIHYADGTYPIGVVTSIVYGTVTVKWLPDTVKASVSFRPPIEFGWSTNSLSIIAKAG